MLGNCPNRKPLRLPATCLQKKLIELLNLLTDSPSENLHWKYFTERMCNGYYNKIMRQFLKISQKEENNIIETGTEMDDI